MVLKLYGNPLSTCTRRVAVVLHEKNIPYDFFPIDFAKGEHKASSYLEKQPFGQVPYIDDEGLVMFESRAICRYIEAKFADKGPKLAPTTSDLPKYALYEQASSIEQSNFDVFASGAAAEKLFKPMHGRGGSPELGDALLASLESKLEGYEKLLSKQKYLAGDEITLADLYHLTYGALLPKLGFTTLETGANGKPNVARWWKDITSRPAWLAVKDGVPGIKA
ncbi:thioredoxin-like protein [Peniophora sp. CONT]|nr:thioredoxin-like protein [Peniophora sp. CONT]